jgi:hypothetical protein
MLKIHYGHEEPRRKAEPYDPGKHKPSLRLPGLRSSLRSVVSCAAATLGNGVTRNALDTILTLRI